jgi:hypothetical protein
LDILTSRLAALLSNGTRGSWVLGIGGLGRPATLALGDGVDHGLQFAQGMGIAQRVPGHAS